MKLTHLRANIFQVFEKIGRTGRPIEVECKGRLYQIVPRTPVDRFASASYLSDCIVGDPEELDQIDWSKEWSRGLS